jgi:hypothetical protein
LEHSPCRQFSAAARRDHSRRHRGLRVDLVFDLLFEAALDGNFYNLSDNTWDGITRFALAGNNQPAGSLILNL